MTLTALMLLASSFGILILGGYAWFLTSSRSIVLNTIIGVFCMMFAASHASVREDAEWAVILPFFTTMLFAGRGLGIWLRSEENVALRRPAQVMAIAAGLALIATITAWVTLTRQWRSVAPSDSSRSLSLHTFAPTSL